MRHSPKARVPPSVELLRRINDYRIMLAPTPQLVDKKSPQEDREDRVAVVAALPAGALAALFASYGLRLLWVADGETIPGSYWGEREAGLIADALYVRADTPVHSALHEACHWLLATPDRRANMHTNAGGCDTEENAVCYLQCLLAEQLAGYSQARCWQDMDDWGYSFILGSAAAWFHGDSDDAIAFLQARGWLTNGGGL